MSSLYYTPADVTVRLTADEDLWYQRALDHTSHAPAAFNCQVQPARHAHIVAGKEQPTAGGVERIVIGPAVRQRVGPALDIAPQRGARTLTTPLSIEIQQRADLLGHQARKFVGGCFPVVVAPARA